MSVSSSAGSARVVLVTGGSSGIGKAVCLRAARAGDHLVLVARGRSALEETARECARAGAASTMVCPVDVADDAGMSAVVSAVVGRHGAVDAVVSCAAVVAYGRIEDVPADIFERVLRTNLVGPVTVARHVLPHMRRRGRGHLILVGSVLGHIAAPTMASYVLSKWGVRALAQQLRIENRDVRDLHLDYISPGGVDTPIYAQAANYSGYVGRPPPPVASPERIASVVMRRLDRPGGRSQVGLANEVIRFGFNVVPWAYDALVGPLFHVAAKDRTSPVAPTPGNVLTSRPVGNRVHGDQGSATLGVLRNIVRLRRD